MSTVNLTFVDVATGAEADAVVPLITTREQIIETLVDSRLIVAESAGPAYEVQIKGKAKLSQGSTLRDAGAVSGDRVLISRLQAGGATDPAVRRARLASDVEELGRLPPGGCISARALSTPPEQFEFRYRLSSYLADAAGGFRLHGDWLLRVQVPHDYPRTGCFRYEDVRFIGSIPFNPHVFSDGRVCLGGFLGIESLWALARRIGLMLQLDPQTLRLDDAANGVARDHCRAGRFAMPCDRTLLPDVELRRTAAFALGGIRRA